MTSELEKLKAKNRELKAVHSTNVALSEELFKYKAENKRLKQTLDEIKEIAEFDCSCGHNQMCICNVCDKFEQILQKIREVIDET